MTRISDPLTTANSLQVIPAFKAHTLRALAQTGMESNVITYYLSGPNETIKNPWTSRSIESDDQLKYLGTFLGMFEQLEESTGLDFEPVRSTEEAMIDIHLYNDPRKITDQGNSGMAIPLENSTGKWWTVLWSDVVLDRAKPFGDYGIYTAHHEIGHSMGFSHPDNLPRSLNYNTSDTLMSYNFDNPLPATYNPAEESVTSLFYREYTSRAVNTIPVLNIEKTAADTHNTINGPRGTVRDEITGLSDVNDQIDANGGDDTIYLSSGYDQIRTGTGRDTIVITKDLIDDYMGFSSIMDHNPQKDTVEFSQDILRDDELMDRIHLVSMGHDTALQFDDTLLAVFDSSYDDVSSQPWTIALDGMPIHLQISGWAI